MTLAHAPRRESWELGDLVASKTTRSGPALVRDTLDAVANADDNAYIEVDEASAALAAAEIVAAVIGNSDQRLSEDARAWLVGNKEEIAGISKTIAREAVERVLAGSELRQLWDETGADTDWHHRTRELLSILR